MESSGATHYFTKEIFGLQVHWDTLVLSWLIMAIFLIISLYIRSILRLMPGRVQSAVEMVISYFEDLAVSMAGEKGKQYVPYILSIFLFILGCNWLGLIPHFIEFGHVSLSMSPTRDICTTLALAIISFFAFQYCGYREKGIRFIGHYLYPIPLLVKALPWYLYFMIPPLTILFVFLNIIEELARVLSLSFRLMGNIMGEHIVATSLLDFVVVVAKMGAVGVILSFIVDVFPVFMLFLGLLVGAIQALVFSVLTLSYISHAIEEEH